MIQLTWNMWRRGNAQPERLKPSAPHQVWLNVGKNAGANNSSAWGVGSINQRVQPASGGLVGLLVDCSAMDYFSYAAINYVNNSDNSIIIRRLTILNLIIEIILNCYYKK